MKIVFSDHANEQMRERNLSEAFISRVLANPDRVVRQSSKRYRAQKDIRKGRKKYLLIVVYDIVHGVQEIVTAFITTKFHKYL